ncbi:hypothetical protein DBR32_03470 [Taibaiella sp. KBW10]|uniref:hypothetical protein n=1 Tax=Taibaiella sp. KBW10 TaxID=2153357 RepID=UPI000F5A9F1F|nr:hypothetical protein [Taibaiella sp. KBW10]RQO31877.1 hypothetical protein DBR32_03470 [Taibaiella sp. KBW10]
MKKEKLIIFSFCLAGFVTFFTSCKKETLTETRKQPLSTFSSEFLPPQDEVVYAIERYWTDPVDPANTVRLLHLKPGDLDLLSPPIVIPQIPEQRGFYKGVCYDPGKDELICMTRGYKRRDDAVIGSQFVYVDKNTAQLLSTPVEVITKDGKPFVLGGGDLEYRYLGFSDDFPPPFGLGVPRGGITMYASVNAYAENDFLYHPTAPGIYRIIWDGVSATAEATMLVDFAPLGLASGNAHRWDGITARFRQFTLDQGNGVIALVADEQIFYTNDTKIYKFDKFGNHMGTDPINVIPYGACYGLFNRNTSAAAENHVGGGFTQTYAVHHITGPIPGEVYAGMNMYRTYPSSGGEGLSVLDFAAKFVIEKESDGTQWTKSTITIP